MSRGRCTPEQRAACPLMMCVGSDTHHLAYPANQYRTRIEKQWRELAFNKEQVPRCLHNAIHASGYIPEKPSRDEMLDEIWREGRPMRALEERLTQLALGQALLQETPGDAA